MSAPAPQPAPAPAPAPTRGLAASALFVVTGALMALGAGLGQGIISANLYQIAGDVGATTAETSWLYAAYLIPRACLPLLLIKVRTQYGLRHFVELTMGLYALAAFAGIWMQDLRSAIVIETLSGMASAALTTLAFLYIMEPLAPAWRLRLGLPVAMTMLLGANSFARVISPPLIDDGGLLRIHLQVLGLTLVSYATVLTLKLTPVPHQKVIKPLDLVSFALIASGFGAIIVASVMGPIHWWRDAAWIGAALAAGVAALTLAAVIELRRAAPLLDIRWLASPAMLHLTAALMLFRMILSEQSTGAPRMFQALGLAPAQLVTLFTLICIASVLGGLACVGWMKPGREPQFHFVALVLIAVGAFMDSQATIDTRPEQMFVSQSLIAFASLLFMPPAMMAGLVSALRKGPQYLLSFIIVFISTQSIGGMVGAGLFTTITNHRQAYHQNHLLDQLTAGSVPFQTELTARMAALAGQIPDAAARRAQALSQISTEVSNQAYVMAYNDAYFLTFLAAVAAGCALALHVLRDALAARAAARAAASAVEPTEPRNSTPQQTAPAS